MSAWPYPLLGAWGVEIEYMIVDAQTLDVRPWADRVLRDPEGTIQNELRQGEITWCNELARHVLELKCAEPAASLSGLAGAFAANVRTVNERLAPLGAVLMPGGMHPWMDPDRELVLWEQENREIYQAYDRIFGCRGHGWANLQSTQINLSFNDDAGFGRLHAAIRLVLPLLTGLTASTPLMDGRATGRRCNRMAVYRHNSDRVPSVSGDVVPEPIFSIAGYRELLAGLYRDIAPLDPAGVLQEEWLNSRGAIARFDRGSIEIRTMDSQECASADLGLVEVVGALVRALVEERWSGLESQQSIASAPLVDLFIRSIGDGEDTICDHAPLSKVLGLRPGSQSLARSWGQLTDRLSATGDLGDEAERVMEHLLTRGTLATRLLRRLGDRNDRRHQRELWRRLVECLNDNRMLD